MRADRSPGLAAILLLVVLAPVSVSAQVQQQYVGLPIAEVRLSVEARPTVDAELRDVLETQVGRPLTMIDVRESIVHLMALGRFENVEVYAEPSPGGVTLRYTLIPVRTVRSVVFRGTLGLDQDLLRREVRDRYGSSPPLGRADDIALTLEGLYRDHGFARASVTQHVDDGQGTRVTLVFDVDPGPRATIGQIRVEGDGRIPQAALLDQLGARRGAPYDPSELTRRASAYAEGLRARGFYEAVIEATPRFLDDGTVNLDILAMRGPRVTVVVRGEAVPGNTIDELVPYETEKSVDQDVLEDWSGNIVRYLQAQGYRYADARFARQEQDGQLAIVFDVKPGPRHLVEDIVVSGNNALPTAEIVRLLGVQPGQPLNDRSVQAGTNNVMARYYAEGFTAVAVRPSVTARSSTPTEVRTRIALQVTEGLRTEVASVRAFVNGAEVPPAKLPVERLQTRVGAPFYLPTLNGDRNELLAGYLNLGYESATVTVPDPVQMITDDGTRANVRFDILTGPQILVDHVLVVGNNRTKASAIRKQVALAPGEPLALDKVRETEQRLSALGLFRRVRVTELQHGGETRRDVLVTVEESPATTIAYGGGVEGAKRLRRNAAGVAESAIELAPRGLFEIGRRNLFGGNRSINFSSSVAVRPRSTSVVGTGLREYRAIGSYREPGIFGGLADLLVTGGVEQTVRTSYSFHRWSVYGQATRRLSPTLSAYGRYSIERTRLFNEQVSEEERLLIDIRFPQVRISRLASSLVRDTRDDALDPSRGGLASFEGNLAPRFIGSEVGFVKALAQAFVYRRLPVAGRRIVFAAGARLGLATGFERTAPTGEIVADVPISERFFSGNTVRGFVEDRLGRPDTLTPEGFPKGGNGQLIFNAELRTSVWKDFVAVAFLDAGNVYLRASQLDPAKLRPGIGVGFRYRSPFGPIRLDIGFNPSRRTFGNGTREPLTALYFGIGQAF